MVGDHLLTVGLRPPADVAFNFEAGLAVGGVARSRIALQGA